MIQSLALKFGGGWLMYRDRDAKWIDLCKTGDVEKCQKFLAEEPRLDPYGLEEYHAQALMIAVARENYPLFEWLLLKRRAHPFGIIDIRQSWLLYNDNDFCLENAEKYCGLLAQLRDAHPGALSFRGSDWCYLLKGDCANSRDYFTQSIRLMFLALKFMEKPHEPESYPGEALAYLLSGRGLRQFNSNLESNKSHQIEKEVYQFLLDSENLKVESFTPYPSIRQWHDWEKKSALLWCVVRAAEQKSGALESETVPTEESSALFLDPRLAQRAKERRAMDNYKMGQVLSFL